MTKLLKNPILWGSILFVIAGGLLVAVFDFGLHRDHPLLTGWLAYSLLLGVAAVCLLGVIRLLDVHRRAAYPAIAAFFLRLVIGAALMALLPVAGYQTNEVTRAGYVFRDAYFRDRQAFEIADFGRPILKAFLGDADAGDQYGGLLATSASIYRYISPDAHRPYLIIILTALMAGLGTLFVWGAARQWFGEGIALTTAWIFSLYPESVLLGSSQMRESFVMAGIAIAFYSFVKMTANQPGDRVKWPVWLILSAVILFMFQPPVGLATFIALFLAWMLDPNRNTSWWRAVLYVGILAFGVFIVFIVWANLPSLQGVQPGNIFFAWLQHNFNFQSFLAVRSSGILQKLVRGGSDALKVGVVLGYGFAQPVLPAALVVLPDAWIWWVVNVLRALGWYLLAPFLIYALITSLRAKAEPRRFQLIWLSLMVWIWIFISSANAGGDQWDNPRYRAIFLVFEALLAAWGWAWARAKADVWLKRWMLVEGACVLVFTDWYIGREYLPVLNLGIRNTILLAASISMLIIAGGWLMDRQKVKT